MAILLYYYNIKPVLTKQRFRRTHARYQVIFKSSMGKRPQEPIDHFMLWVKTWFTKIESACLKGTPYLSIKCQTNLFVHEQLLWHIVLIFSYIEKCTLFSPTFGSDPKSRLRKGTCQSSFLGQPRKHNYRSQRVYA